MNEIEWYASTKHSDQHVQTHPILRLGLQQGCHDTSPLERQIARPIRPARRDEDMARPGFEISIQLMIFIDLESLGIREGATRAVLETIRSVDLGFDFGKQGIWWAHDGFDLLTARCGCRAARRSRGVEDG